MEPQQINPPKPRFLKRLIFGEWLGQSMLIVIGLTLSIVVFAFLSDSYFQETLRLLENKKNSTASAFALFNTETNSADPAPTPEQKSDGCYVIVSGYVYNMTQRIGKTAVDPNTGKTHVHTKEEYACGTIDNPTDMTEIYRDTHSPMGCANRIAPFIVKSPAPIDPTCK
jgi:hypothetical protein